MANRSFGHVLGVAVGVIFENRNDLGQAGVHRPRMAGISYSEREGADSIIISGGYEDDEDHGDLIIYTGPRGKRSATGRQIADQQFTRGT